MPYQHIRLNANGAVTTLTLARPQVLNAFSRSMLEELHQALDAVRDSPARALLLTGAGRAFSSGADLAPAPGEGLDRSDMGARLERLFNPLVERMRRLPIPVVVAVNGPAAGGGCGIALAGDVVLAARSAYFLLPFAGIGLVPDVGATWLLPRLVGRARAIGMMMLGDRIDAAQAEQWGLIWQAVDDDRLIAEATAIAARLAAGPSVSYRLMREAVDAGLHSSWSDSLALERVNQRTAGRTADHAEGVAAFLEKRAPAFGGN